MWSVDGGERTLSDMERIPLNAWPAHTGTLWPQPGTRLWPTQDGPLTVCVLPFVCSASEADLSPTSPFGLRYCFLLPDRLRIWERDRRSWGRDHQQEVQGPASWVGVLSKQSEKGAAQEFEGASSPAPLAPLSIMQPAVRLPILLVSLGWGKPPL